MIIAFSFSEFVNNNSEKLRDLIVFHQDKIDLKLFYLEADPKFQDMNSPNFR